MEGTSPSRGPTAKQPCPCLPPVPPHTGNTPSLSKPGKKGHGPARVGQDIQAWQNSVPVCARHKPAGSKEGREQFKVFLSFYLPFQNSPFLTRFTNPNIALGELSVTGQTGGHRLKESLSAEADKAGVTPGQTSSPAPSVTATAPASTAAGWPRSELGQTRWLQLKRCTFA